jgi:hypothetical protein
MLCVILIMTATMRQTQASLPSRATTVSHWRLSYAGARMLTAQ